MFNRILKMFLATRVFRIFSHRKNHRFAGTGGWGSRHASSFPRFNRRGSEPWLVERRKRLFPWF